MTANRKNQGKNFKEEIQSYIFNCYDFFMNPFNFKDINNIILKILIIENDVVLLLNYSQFFIIKI
jgi:hypothetical protein